MGAVRFGEPERLKKSLQESGLWSLGVDSLTFFWEEIVNPTWQEGSTTQIGYRELIVQSLNKKLGASNVIDPNSLPNLQPDVDSDHSAKLQSGRSQPSQLQNSATAFTEHYFSASTFDLGWQPLLSQLVHDPDCWLLIATDHYAEATEHICHQLRRFGFTGRSLLDARATSSASVDSSTVWVANSADLGGLKSTPQFWMMVRANLLPAKLDRIVLIDDFGSNEQGADMYAQNEKVKQRMTQTNQVIGEQFGVEPTIVHFDLSGQSNNWDFSNIHLVFERPSRK